MNNKETLKETIEKKTRKEKYIKILLATIFSISLILIGFVIGNPKLLTNIKGSLENIIKKENTIIQSEDIPDIEEVEDGAVDNTEDVTENPTEEEKLPVEESPLKCTQYEYDYATAFIAAATPVYNDLYNSYQTEVAEYEDCMYGQTYNELYDFCDSKLSSLITDPVTRGNLIRQCIQSYYSDCEMNNSSDWYETQMALKLAAINEQKAILDSCY